MRRRWETTNDFIADFTVGLQTGHLKTSAPYRRVRGVKYLVQSSHFEDKSKALVVECRYAGAGFSAHENMNISFTESI